MFSALTSLIWGTEEETPTSETSTKERTHSADDQIEIENDWIFICPMDRRRRRAHFIDDGASTALESADSVGCSMEESWLVTPPQCFNGERKYNKAEMSPMENLLIEHPSMSIYQGNEDATEEQDDETSDIVIVNRPETHRAIAGRMQLLDQRQPLKDVNNKLRLREQKNIPKNMKRKNMVYVRSHNTRKNKQYGRMSGKHVGMAGKRGT